MRGPALRPGVALIEQLYRGEQSFVVKDPATHKYFRFRPADAAVLRAFDGSRSAEEIASALAGAGLAISAGAIESFARTLSRLGLLERSLTERSGQELERLQSERRRRRSLFRGEWLRMRWSVGDSDRFFSRAMPYLRWCFTPWFVGTSIGLFLAYAAILAARWSDFSTGVAATFGPAAIDAGTAAVLVVTFLGLTLIHELAHGFACKYFGGEVREMGFMLLYFQPAFYCNVSDAWSFPERRARLWVTAAGSWIQIVVASLAAIMWWAAAPGTLIADIGVAAMLVGGLTTLLTNANPLLPLDGYFALADWLEIPNLRHRAFAHFEWWFKSRALRLEVPQPPAGAHERRIFLTYGLLATLYVSAIFVFLAALLLGWARAAFGTFGVVLTIGLLFAQLRTKIAQWGRTVALSIRARLDPQSAKSRRLRFAIALGVITLVMLLPWTLTSGGSLVVRPAESQTVTAADSGVIDQVYVSEGARVDAGAPLIRLVNRAFEGELLSAGRLLDSLTSSEAAARAAGRAGDAERFAAERASALAQFGGLERRMAAMTIRASVPGVVASPRPEYLLGRAVGAGDSLLTLATLDSVELRIALSSGGATRVRPGQTVHAISYGDGSSSWTGRVSEIAATAVAVQGSSGVIEARVRRAASESWKPGVIGEASVEIERSTVIGALWWKARQLLRTDLWL